MMYKLALSRCNDQVTRLCAVGGMMRMESQEGEAIFLVLILRTDIGLNMRAQVSL